MANATVIHTAAPYGGTFSWEPADPQDELGVVDLVIETITYGDQGNVGFEFAVDNVDCSKN